MNQKKYVIEATVLERVLNHLANQPWKETNELIVGLMKAELYEEPESLEDEPDK